MQADILDLGKLGKQFDIVESVGVLHHMNDPMVGWGILTQCLKPGGLMKIGLYSELARQIVVKMRDEISQSGLGSCDNQMRLYRSGVIASGKENHKEIFNSSDFYSLSTLRDLLFHVQEHRFTLPQIKYALGKLGLKFCGFEAPMIVEAFKRRYGGSENSYDLDKWDIFEHENPETFKGMYQFWCQKI